MFVNKIGQEHIEMGMNCQDYGYEDETYKIVCDGCSEGKHTEVGAKTFCHLFPSMQIASDVFEKWLIPIFGKSASSIRDFLCFTVLHVYEMQNMFGVSNCGDGYIILEDHDGNITFEELCDGEYPKYFAYNYCDPNSLKHYKDGVKFDYRVYSKEKYKNVGVASDGLRYILRLDEELVNEFTELLKTKSAVKIKRFINRNQKLLKDDITIVF